MHPGVTGVLSLSQVVIMAIVQGITELFPVSSVGHNVLVPTLFGWHINQSGPQFLPFLVVLHLGTAVALLLYFWRDWIGIAKSLVDRKLRMEGHLFELVVVGTIPSVVLGYVIAHRLTSIFGAALLTGVMLIVNGGVLLLGDQLRRGNKPAADLGGWQALVVGVCQATALIPGMSRSGAAMVGTMAYGIEIADAARFTFLLGFPVILGAGVLEVPKLLHTGTQHELTMALLAGVLAGLAAYFAVWFLMRYFNRRNVHAFRPFALYCFAVGLMAIASSVFKFTL